MDSLRTYVDIYYCLNAFILLLKKEESVNEESLSEYNLGLADFSRISEKITC